MDADSFRSAIGRLPAGVAVVSLRLRGIDHASTVSSVASVSLEPPLVLFGVHVDARLREALDEQDLWVLSVLADDQAPVADWLASPGRPAFDQLSRVDHVREERTDGAIIVGAAAWFACRTSAVHRAGDHDLVVGEVLELGEGEPTAGGLVHHRGRLRAVTGAERRIARGNRRQAGSA
jgi:flavin reductase (DIM6/NTAB) family NADH-FMN oxidoreductase RutF